jgi:hypothetical protein
MRWIVLPFVAAAVAATDVIYPVSALDVRIAIEVVVHVDVDVAAAPTASPTPSAATPGSAD